MLFLCLFLLTFQDPKPTDTFNEAALAKEAKQHLNERRFDEAIVTYDSLIFKTGDKKYTYYLASAQQGAGDYSAAIRNLNYLLKGAKSDYKKAAYLWNLAAVHSDNGDYESAKNYAKQTDDICNQLVQREDVLGNTSWLRSVNSLLFKNFISIAEIATNEGNEEEGYEYLTRAYNLGVKFDFNLHYFYWVQSFHELSTGNCEAALNYAQSRILEFSEASENRIGRAELDYAFIAFAAGHYELAAEKLFTCRDKIKDPLFQHRADVLNLFINANQKGIAVTVEQVKPLIDDDPALRPLLPYLIKRNCK